MRMGGSRGDTRRAFERSLVNAETTLILLDSEVAVREAHGFRPWDQLRVSDGWQRPDGASEAHCHLMVQCMESWFLADREIVAEYFGRGFHDSSLARNPRVEQVPKADVLRSLERATRNTKKKGYSKGAHAFQVLARLDPEKIENASPWAKRFFDHLRAL